ncbi:MAG: hypothetical protein E7580_00670 [Ruminococcaceae bacterium]|nr:hypothetical protein [Oscillospiraceae bacterium]
MKKMRISLTAFCLAAVMLLTVLAAGCSEESEEAIGYRGESVNCAIFQYLCSQKKTDYLYEAYGVDSSSVSSSQLQDNPSIWKAVSADGVTVADTLKQEVRDELMLYLYMSNYAKSQGYSLGAEEKNYIKSEFDNVVSGYGDKKTFNNEMKKYGVDYEQVLEFNYLQTMAYQGMNLMFGENGTNRISEEALRKYYNGNYATVSLLFINTKYKTLSNGKVVGLPEEEKTEKIALAEQAYEKAKAGSDFSALIEEYSDEKGDAETLKNGSTFLKGSFVDATAEKKIWEMKTGDIVRVDTENGVYILYKRPLNESYFEKAKEAIRTELEDKKKAELVEAAKKDFKINEEFIKGLNIQEIPHVV